VALPLAACGGGGGVEGGLPALELPALDGSGTLRLDEVEGPAVVNLWATWCAPCRRELPDFDAVAAETEGEVRFLGVNVSDRAEDAAAFIDELGIGFEQYLDLDGELSAELGTATLPVTLLVDAEGVIRIEHLGPLDEQGLRDAIAEVSTGGSAADGGS
jgi:thiol-disulfide isomerase/thioredoxin